MKTKKILYAVALLAAAYNLQSCKPKDAGSAVAGDAAQ